MRAAGLLLCYLAGVFLVGALLAPWLFQAGQWAGTGFAPLKGLASQPFHRYVNRSLLAAAVLGLWPLLWMLNLGGRSALGLTNPLAARRELGLGLALGFGSLLLAVVIQTAGGTRSFHLGQPPTVLLGLLATATSAALAVALLEETVFRGVVFGALRRNWPLWVALGASSAIYSAVHFFARVEHTGPVGWDAGLALLPRMMRGMTAPENFLPALTLAVAGTALGLARERTGNLWFAVGLHAGWVFWLKVFKTVTVSTGTANAFWGTERLLDGWLACLVMVGVLAVVARLPRREQTAAGPDESATRSACP